MQLLKRLVAEPRADVTDIPPAVLLAHCEGKRSKERPRPPGRRETRDDDFLAFRSLDLQPVVGAGARQIFAVRALGHDALKAFALRFLEELCAAMFCGDG